MHIKNLFFHIHYCNCRQLHETRPFRRKVVRTLPHHELIFITGGSGDITVDQKKYSVKKGMLFYICPDVLHSIETSREEPIYFFSVHFSYAEVSFEEGKWAVRDEKKMLPIQPAQELKDYYPIEDIFKKLVDTWNAKLPGYEFITKTILQQLLVALYQNKRRQNPNYANSLKVERVIAYMHQHIQQRVTLPELSAVMHMSPFYLSRTFKMITGYSIIEYFNRIKIDKAKELIVEGDKKVKEVAQALGFTDEFYFSRIFKKVEGVSPSEFYRKNVHGF